MSAAKARAEIKSFQNMFKSLGQLLEDLDEPAKLEAKSRQLEQKINEQTRKLDEMSRVTKDLEAEHARLVKANKDEAAKTDTILKGASARANTIIAKAEGQAQDLKEAANAGVAEALGKVEDAKAAGEAAKANAQADAKEIIRKAQARVAEINDTITDRSEYLNLVRNETAAAERQLAAAKAEIDKIRKQFAS